MIQTPCVVFITTTLPSGTFLLTLNIDLPPIRHHPRELTAPETSRPAPPETHVPVLTDTCSDAASDANTPQRSRSSFHKERGDGLLLPANDRVMRIFRTALTEILHPACP